MLFLRFLIPLAVFAFITRAQTVDEIIAKNIQARGGLEKIKNLQSLRVSGKLAVGNFRAAFVEENKRPFKVREEQIIQGMVGIDAYDGKLAWHVVPWEGRKEADLLSADDRKGLVEDADIEGQLVDYKNKDHRAEYMGHDSVEGTDCYKIKLSLATGDVRYYFIDCDTFLELKEENELNIRGTVRYTETFYGDYEKVDGVYFPYAIETGNKGDSEHVKLTIEKIAVNPPLPDSRFAMPAPAGAVKQ
jgi:outer membrane lipoprotein-sorting protein